MSRRYFIIKGEKVALSILSKDDISMRMVITPKEEEWIEMVRKDPH